MPVFAGKSFQAQTPPSPISGGTLLTIVAEGMPLALASDPDEDVVHVVTLGDSPTELGRVALQAGDEPGRLVADGAGRVHVVLRRGGAIATLVPTSSGASLSLRRSVCSAPRGIDYDAKTDSLWVACATGELVQLPAAGGAPTFTTKLQRDLRDVIVDGSKLYITRFRSAQILTFDLSKLVLDTGSALPQLPLKTQSAAPDVAWRAGKLPAGGLRVLFQVASTAPIDIAQPPGVSSYGGSGIEDQQNPGAGGVVSVAVSSFGSGQVSQSVALQSNPVVDMVASGDDFQTVSLGGVIENGRGERFDLPADDGQTSGKPDEFVAIARSGNQVVVQRRGAIPALVVLHQSDASQSLKLTSMQSTVLLKQSVSHVDTGLDVFSLPTNGGIACMNCHPEGGDDGHTWTFQANDGDRVRRTQSLRGGVITSSAPYHWDGDMTDLQVLCDEVFTHRMGGGALVPQTQTPALARFLNSMPRVPVSTSLDQARVTKGQEIFNGAGACASCHQDGHGTMSQNMDIGKIDAIGATTPLQVPILLGVADRAPYMHDGCATTLMDRLNNPACAGTSHGIVQGLTDDDKQNLVEYLESL